MSRAIYLGAGLPPPRGAVLGRPWVRSAHRPARLESAGRSRRRHQRIRRWRVDRGSAAIPRRFAGAVGFPQERVPPGRAPRQCPGTAWSICSMPDCPSCPPICASKTSCSRALGDPSAGDPGLANLRQLAVGIAGSRAHGDRGTAPGILRRAAAHRQAVQFLRLQRRQPRLRRRLSAARPRLQPRRRRLLRAARPAAGLIENVTDGTNAHPGRDRRRRPAARQRGRHRRRQAAQPDRRHLPARRGRPDADEIARLVGVATRDGAGADAERGARGARRSIRA